MPIISGDQLAPTIARLGKMRLGASRLDHYQPIAKVFINGVDRTANVRISNASITHALDSTPDTFSLRVSGITPVKGHDIKFYLGDTDTHHILFAGHIRSVTQVYERKHTNVAFDLQCIDYTWLLNRRKVMAKYTSTSASTLVTSIVSTFTSGFTTVKVESGLESLDEITFTNEDVTDALDRIAQRIGATWFVDYAKDIHFFVTASETFTVTVADTSAAAYRTIRDVAQDTDLSQVATRVWSRGGGSNASSDVLVGHTTLPVEDSTQYSTSGGYVECGPQRITYTGKTDQDGQGCVTAGVPGSAPSAPSVSMVAGTAGNLTAVDNYQWKVTFVSAAGESDAGSASTANVTRLDAPSGVPTLTEGTGGSITAGSSLIYLVAFVDAAGATNPFDCSAAITLSGTGTKVDLSNIPVSADGRCTARRVYRFSNNAPTQGYRLLATIADNTTTTHSDTASDASIAGNAEAPTSNTTGTGQFTVGIPLGPLGTTSRKTYRTTEGGSTFKLQSTTGNNTTTSITDNVADGSLGADLGTSTLGASPGDTSLRVTDLTKFPAAGWVRAPGQQVMSYTARSASTGEGNLTGIPASGAGAITSTIPAGSTVVVEPHLTGIASSGDGSIVYALTRGDAVNVLTASNDTTAQTAMAGFVGGDGIHEEFISDGRVSMNEAQARGDATLDLAKDPLVTVTGSTRDQAVRVGRTLTLSLGAPTSLSGSFKVQEITLSEIAVDGGKFSIFPLRSFTASSRRFSFEQVLRGLRAAS